MKNNQEKGIFSTAERQVMLEKMEEASTHFYRMATAIGNHAFIEFCGLMNEYIKLCHMFHERGEDFTRVNIHLGNQMPSYMADYFAEKISCILGAEFRLVPVIPMRKVSAQ